MGHKCDTLLICCIDFRLQKHIRKWTDENLAGKTFDLVGFAGSSKEIETVIKQIDISVRLHEIDEVVIIHHEDCGAYGQESTRERHLTDMRLTKKEITAKYPQLETRLIYMHLDGATEVLE